MKKCKRILSVVMCLALLAGIVTTAPFTANAVGLNVADVAAASADSTGAGTPVGEKKHTVFWNTITPTTTPLSSQAPPPIARTILSYRKRSTVFL